MKAQIQKFLREEDGITALEYGILAAIVAAVIAFIFKDGLKTLFGHIFDNLTKAVDSAGNYN